MVAEGIRKNFKNMKYHITWTPELKNKIDRAVKFYRTESDSASSPTETEVARKNLVSMAKARLSGGDCGFSGRKSRNYVSRY